MQRSDGVEAPAIAGDVRSGDGVRVARGEADVLGDVLLPRGWLEELDGDRLPRAALPLREPVER